MVQQVGDTRRPTLKISVYDGNTVPSLNIIMPDGSASPLSLSGPVAQGDGSGLWTATAPYTLSVPGRWYERFTVVNLVTGIGAGAESYPVDVEATPPAIPAGAWATPAQYFALIGGSPPTNLPFLLYRATLQLKPYVGLSLYETTDTAVLTAMATACCLQVAYAQENGWTTGAPVLAAAGQIGSVRVDAPKRSDGSAGAMPGISPEAWQVLYEASLTDNYVSTDLPGWTTPWSGVGGWA